LDAVDQMLDAPQVRRARSTDHAEDVVALLEQQLGEIGPVLACDSGDNGSLGHETGNFIMTTTGEVDRFARHRQDADRRYNGALTALDRAIVRTSAQPAIDRAELSALATALIVFLQQITLFVESKDREIVANEAARFAAVDRSLETLAELRVQMSVVQ